MKTKFTSITLAAACLALLGATPINLRAATITVANNADSGPGSLREALASAVNSDTIDASGVTGTITLTSDQLWVSNSVTLLGPGPGALTVTATNGMRVFAVTGTNVTISGLTIANAQGAGYGMGILTGFGISLALNNCIISSNSTTLSGGGIFMSAGATLTVSNCTICDNSASASGGGVYNNHGVLAVVESTLSGNSAGGGGGGGIDNWVATVEIGDTILNASAGGGNIYSSYGSVISDGYNLSSDGSGSSFLIATGDQNNIDPKLGPLQDNGGSTPTHALLPDSPAIDQGKSFGLSTDQRGLPRPVDFFSLPDAAGGDTSDIGAFEFQKTQPTLVTSTNDSGPGALREALASATNGDTVDASGVTGTITLANGQLEVAKSVTVLGPGAAMLTVSGNHATRVFDVTGTNVVISGLTIANGYGAGYGIGIKTYGAGSKLTVDNCVLTNNSTTLSGGGIFNDPGVTIIVTNSTLCGNSAPSGSGGGIYNYQGTLIVANSTLSGNSGDLGAGIYNDAVSGPATLTVTASTLNNNSANYGGGIYNHGLSVDGAMVTIVNSTFSANNSHVCIGNDGAWGGHVVLTIMASTFSGNIGVGIYNDGRFGGNATLELGDTILSPGSADASIDNADAAGTVKTDGYNLSSDNGGGCLTNATDQTNVTNLLLGPLQDNGGRTWTHALFPGSPAIDQGYANAVPGLGVGADQRGLARPVNFFTVPDASGGDASDIGAFEFPKTQPTIVTSTNDSGPGSLREALASAASGDTVDATGVAGTITLTSGELSVSNNLTLLGPGAGTLTVSGNHLSRVFTIWGGNVWFSGLTIADGQDVNGGGIFIMTAASLTISHCNIFGNKVSQDAGGIYNFGTLAVIASTISSNSAYAYAGGIHNCGTLTVYGSTFSRNSVTVNGGAIYNDGSSSDAMLTINASTFSTNSAQYGGAIDNEPGYYSGHGAVVRINASTFSGNSASAYGGGIFNFNYPGNAVVNVADSLFNAGSSGANLYSYYGFVFSYGYNLSSDDGSGFLTQTGDQTNTPALLGPLQNNGGPTPTHALLANSPAIDKGKTNALPGLELNIDQRGLTRPVQFFTVPDATSGDASDIGAFEFQKTQPTTVTSTNDSGPGSLREAIASATNGDTVDATGVTGTITLTNGQLEVAESVTVLGPGAATLTVSGNHAGRVFDVTGTNVMISGLTIADGYGAGYGTGIKTYGAGTRLTVNNCVLTNNSSTLNGGGIFNDPSVMMIVSNCTICGNSGTEGGGIVNLGDLTVVGSTLSGNTAVNYGGAIENYSSGSTAALTINASTFSGNSASIVGGIFNDADYGYATVEIDDTILKTGASGVNIYNLYNDWGTLTSQGYSLSSDGSGSSFLVATGDQNNTDPKLGPLQNNGGPTPTHALLSGSPAIDQGYSFGLVTDQRGMPRPVNFAGIPNASGGDGSDIGAFEAQIVPGGSPLRLTGPVKSGSGGPFQFAFTNTPGASFTVFTTTNLALAFSNWTVLGVPLEIAPGQFQFADPQATNHPQGFYRVTSP